MAKISWFTQPHTNRGDLHFASFYMYDTDNRNFVRIRLDLRRTHGSGKAKIICKKNRIVLSGDNMGHLEIINNNSPQADRKIYDFTIGHNNIHHGNRVTGNEYLPDEITVDELTKVALKYIDENRDGDIDLVDKNATEHELSVSILKLIQ